MSEQQNDVPPVGEEIHLPGPSIQPLLLTVGITITLVGVTTALWMVIAGGIMTVAVLVSWIRGARQELAELPADHSAGH